MMRNWNISSNLIKSMQRNKIKLPKDSLLIRILYRILIVIKSNKDLAPKIVIIHKEIGLKIAIIVILKIIFIVIGVSKVIRLLKKCKLIK